MHHLTPVYAKFEVGNKESYRLLRYTPWSNVLITRVRVSSTYSPGKCLDNILGSPGATRHTWSKQLVVIDGNYGLSEQGNHIRDDPGAGSHDALSVIRWDTMNGSLQFLVGRLLALTPHLRRLEVALRHMPHGGHRETFPRPLELPSAPYTFSLVTFECGAELPAPALARIISCSAQTLTTLALLVPAAQFALLVPMLPELPALMSLRILPVVKPLDRALVQRALERCPRLRTLALAMATARDAAPLRTRALPGLQTLSIYHAWHDWDAALSKALSRALRGHPRLRTLHLFVTGIDGDALTALRRPRLALRTTMLRTAHDAGYTIYDWGPPAAYRGLIE